MSAKKGRSVRAWSSTGHHYGQRDPWRNRAPAVALIRLAQAYSPVAPLPIRPGVGIQHRYVAIRGDIGYRCPCKPD